MADDLRDAIDARIAKAGHARVRLTGRIVGQATERHVCNLPAEWIPDTLWRCYEGHLWAVDTACGTCRWLGKGEGGARHACTVGLAWWPASWWRRRVECLKTGLGLPMRRARLDMAGENRVEGGPKPAPPSARLTPPPDAED